MPELYDQDEGNELEGLELEDIIDSIISMYLDSKGRFKPWIQAQVLEASTKRNDLGLWEQDQVLFPYYLDEHNLGD